MGALAGFITGLGQHLREQNLMTLEANQRANANDAKVLFHLAELTDDPETAMELFKGGMEAQGATDKRFKVGKVMEAASLNHAVRARQAEQAQPKQPPMPLRGPNGTGLSPEEMAQQGRIESTGQFEEALPPPPGGVMTTVPPSGGMGQPGAGMAGSGSGPVLGAPNLPLSPGQEQELITSIIGPRPVWTGQGLFTPRSFKQSQASWDTAARQILVDQAKRSGEFAARRQESEYVLGVEDKRAKAAYQEHVARAKEMGFEPNTPSFNLYVATGKFPDNYGKQGTPGVEVPFSPEVLAQKKELLRPPSQADARTPDEKNYDRYVKEETGTGRKIMTFPDFLKWDANLKAVRTPAPVDEARLEGLAQSIAAGDLTRIRDVMNLRAGNGTAGVLLFDMIRKLNPKFSTAELDRKIKMESDFTTGKDGQNIQSLGIFLEHAGAASEAIQSMRNVTNSRLLNRPVNWWKTNVSGDPQFQSFMVALDPVRKEFESFLLGGRALYAEDRKTAEKILDDNSSPNQIQAALKQMGHTAKARFTEANYRYKKLMKKDLEEPFSPESIEAARRIGVNLAGKGAVDDKAKGFREKYKY